VKDELNLTSSAVRNSEAKISIQRMATGTIELKVKTDDCNPGIFKIVIVGIIRGTWIASGNAGNASGETKFKTSGSSDSMPLDFAVIGQTIRIELGGVAHYTGIIPTPPTPLTPDDDDGDDD
jgi:hypothetical protein